MVSLEHIGLEVGGRFLLRDATYQFLPGERVGLIGRNGAGKSTLLRAINGDFSLAEGQIHRPGKCTLAYFHQDLLSYHTDNSIYAVASQAFKPLLDLQAEIEALTRQIEAGDTDPQTWDTLTQKQTLFETREGPQVPAKVHGVLHGLGFAPDTHDRAFSTFSGGWRMRVLLAQMLLTQPDLLMLDEPTNHLDLPSIQWLENYLKTFRGSCVIVSHDRFFLDRIADKILEIAHQRLAVYPGNYTFYQEEKVKREELRLKAFENQQKQLADQEKFIERFRYKASKAKQVQSKIKQLEKVERIEAPEAEAATINIRFKVARPSGREVLSVSHLHKRYGDNHILTDAEALISRGDKIALVGANGTGKSTLLRILANHDSFEGERKIGYEVHDAFFAQHQTEALDLSRTIFEEVAASAIDKTEAEIRNVLGSFMFSGEDILKPIKVLSGGEKSRVALVKVLLSEANFILLDEPTNHLDIPSIQVLAEALNAYEGTYVVVAHDRHFLSLIANKVWYLEDAQIKIYPGSFSEYLQWKAERDQEKEAQLSSENSLQSSPAADSADSPNNFQQQKKLKNRIKKLEQQQEKIEAAIEDLEAQVKEIHLAMARPEVSQDFAQLQSYQDSLEQLSTQLTSAHENWEAVVLELEELQENF